MDWLLVAVFMAACVVTGYSGAMFSPGEWYRALNKPRWTPPDGVFPVVWSLLYVCIAVSAARVAPLPDSDYAMGFFAIQIALNALWSPVFFGLKRMRTALFVLFGLWLSVAAMLATFWQLDRIAGALIVPYLAWVTIAGALNYSVLRRNAETAPVTS